MKNIFYSSYSNNFNTNKENNIYSSKYSPFFNNENANIDNSEDLGLKRYLLTKFKLAENANEKDKMIKSGKNNKAEKNIFH